MRAVLLILTTFMIFGCSTTRIIYKPFIPNIICPEAVVPVYEKLNIDNTHEQNMLILADNCEKAIRYIQELKLRIECFEKTVDKFSKEEAMKEMKDTEELITEYRKLGEKENED